MTDDARSRDRVVDAVAASVFVQFAGAAAILPMLPLYLRRHHTSVGLVGLVMASFFAAGVVTQYAAGHLSDRVGHRRIMTAGLALYAIASLGFLSPVGPVGYVALRSLQGLGAGALQLAGLAMVGLVVPLERRGRAFSKVFGAQVSGMAIGPFVGSVLGLAHIRLLFVISAAGAVLGMLPLLVRVPHTVAPAGGEAVARLRFSRALVGVVLVGAIGGLCAGVYEACWSLLMTSRHAAPWQIGLSWTMFSLSFAAFSPIAGRLIDRLDRRRLAIAAMATSSGFIVVYPFIPQPALLIGLGTLEAIGVAVGLPAAQSLLSQLAPSAALGRAQGVFTTAENAAIAVAAAGAGYLFAVHRALPFIAAAVVGSVLTALLPGLWRDVEGHAARAGLDGSGNETAPVSPGRHVGQVVADATANV